jgi:hypothetical protein
MEIAAGIYRVQYKGTVTSNPIHIDILFPKMKESDLNSFLKERINKFEKLNSDNPLTLLSDLNFNKKMHIIHFDNEDLINFYLDNGYQIREFFRDKCVLELKSVRTIK